jgi:hypothetical protein
MKLPQLSLRDLFWLVLVWALALGWWLDRQELATKLAQLEERYFLRFPGVVTAVDPARGLVEIALGSDDGLRRGDTVEWRSNGTMIRLIIVELNYDQSLAKTQESGDAFAVKKGDEVMTRIDRSAWSSRFQRSWN